MLINQNYKRYIKLGMTFLLGMGLFLSIAKPVDVFADATNGMTIDDTVKDLVTNEQDTSETKTTTVDSDHKKGTSHTTKPRVDKDGKGEIIYSNNNNKATNGDKTATAVNNGDGTKTVTITGKDGKTQTVVVTEGTAIGSLLGDDAGTNAGKCTDSNKIDGNKPASGFSSSDKISKMSSEEKKILNSLIDLPSGTAGETSTTSKLTHAKALYSSSMSGANKVAGYQWVAWHKTNTNPLTSTQKKSKEANGKVGGGNYPGMSAKTIKKLKSSKKLWSKIAENNGGKTPEVKDYQFPQFTKGKAVSAWFDKAGFYDVLVDAKYDKITLYGYVKFNYQYTTTVKKTTEKSVPVEDGSYSLAYLKKKYPDLANIIDKAPKEGAKSFSNKTVKKETDVCGAGEQVHKKIVTEYKDITITTTLTDNYNKNEDNQKIKKYYTIKFTKTIKTTTTKTSVKTATTATKQIAQTVIAKDAYASQITQYKTFHLVPKAKGTSTIAKNQNGFWGSITPYYWKTQKTSNASGMPYIWSTNSTGSKATYSNIYGSLTYGYNVLLNTTHSLTWNIACEDVLSDDVECEGDIISISDGSDGKEIQVDPPMTIELCTDCTNSTKKVKTQVHLYETKDKAN